MHKTTVEYPAMVYKKNNTYIANCIMHNLIGFGKTELDAVENLQKSMNEVLESYDVIIKPMPKMLLTH